MMALPQRDLGREGEGGPGDLPQMPHPGSAIDTLTPQTEH